MTQPSRRGFLKTASILAVGSSALGCTTESVASQRATDPATAVPRATGFERPLLAALASAVLPESLGGAGVAAATDAFVAWIDGYDPVAEEMHGYGYADVRYLPADPAPNWRAQLDALDRLAQRVHHKRFTALTLAEQRALLDAALRRERSGDRLPSPLAASHIAIALLAHWASSPAAWDSALGVTVGSMTCRPLDQALRKPLPLAGTSTASTAGPA